LEHKRTIKSYVLRASRMSIGQRQALENYSQKHCIEYSGQPLDYSEYFKNQLCIEVGFGMGNATSQIALHNPDISYLGIEVHVPGVGRLLSNIENEKIDNLKIINHDAVEVLKTMIPESSVAGFHVFFPDPWPKTKHQKRRLINTEFTALLVSRLKIGGYIYTATDWEDYADQMLDVFSANRISETSSKSGRKNRFGGPKLLLKQRARRKTM